MNRVWHRWEAWECVPAGMHDQESLQDPVEAYAEILGNCNRFANAINRVFSEWPVSCEQFLTNTESNRVAWLGQAAVCIETGVGRAYRRSFYELSEKQQSEANKVAADAIARWDSERELRSGGVRKEVEHPRLF